MEYLDEEDLELQNEDLRDSHDRGAGYLIKTWLTEVSSIIWFDFAHPPYLETFCVHTDVAQI